ncbi:MAG: VOC family protein [Bifidobacteriaceae bacterium]|jgi:catechol 2,3-dioxygenase-like lactoylglutathione lyase family enzyme|nr:VOC family protein [Bifidobacteriaceae bacterium]
MTTLGSKKLWHVAINVPNLDEVVQNWATLLGIPVPEIIEVPGPDHVPSYSFGHPDPPNACRLAALELDNVVLELVEPDQSWESSGRGGWGVKHLAFVVPDRREAQDALADLGAPPAYHIGYYPGGTYAFTNATRQLGVEINVKTDDDNRAKIETLRADPASHQADL